MELSHEERNLAVVLVNGRRSALATFERVFGESGDESAAYRAVLDGHGAGVVPVVLRQDDEVSS